MLLDELLNDFPRERFLREHYQRRPYSGRAAAERLLQLGTWDTIDELIERTECDVLLARQDVPYTGERPRTAREARELFAQGYTLALRQPDQHHAGLAQLARTFSAELHGRINLHIYCTPAGHHGFGWHCDPEEVFILQTTGRKDYLLRENTLHPVPLPEALPSGALAAKETTPVETRSLSAGDFIYIPAGHWHMAQAPEEAISISIGLMAPTPLDVLDMVRATLASNPVWRRRLPALGHASGLDDARKLELLRTLFTELGGELQRALSDPGLPLRFLAQTARFYLRAAGIRGSGR
ncbi:cupin domain-containing protein [Myxococcus sp. RHSTA-1-4]|uniref:cupin domain-containing protein n=1 Tax=Myxococcus sp. RHSTA-1-4 TaxID=2874601 RepID=UPI001CC13992|nr:cupin domain-containing protein [Myxococcus sp. RHSTA-1-4]MBZ4417488.1 cupin domain-containing protein [Myxococcus sp. RHSTA-1-4]